MLKRLTLVVLALLMLLGTAFAEDLPAFEAYSATYSAPEGVEWTEKGDLRILKLNDEVEIHICLIG